MLVSFDRTSRPRRSSWRFTGARPPPKRPGRRKGQFRLAENLRQVQTNLERIIPALETTTDKEGPGNGA